MEEIQAHKGASFLKKQFYNKKLQSLCAVKSHVLCCYGGLFTKICNFLWVCPGFCQVFVGGCGYGKEHIETHLDTNIFDYIPFLITYSSYIKIDKKTI